jgi:hypothetical protein
MGGSFGGRRTVGKPRGRRQDAFWRDVVELLLTWNKKAALRKIEA